MQYVNWQVPLWATPKRVRKYFDIPLNGFVEALSEGDGMTFVKYKETLGYVESRFVEEYERVLPFDRVDLSDIQTPEEHDLEQYVNWLKTKQVNMCGEICAAMVFGVKLSDVLMAWEVKKPSFFKRIFGSGKATGTSADDLVLLFEIYGMEALKMRYPKYTPTLFRDLVRRYDLICGVRMNSVTGELRRGSVLHWVVLKEVTLERKGLGWVRVFNPAQNCEEMYSWSEWLAAAGVPSGVMIEKENSG